MKISSETATSLGEKLAALDLTPEEGVLLGTMLSATDHDEEAEVEGFIATEKIEVVRMKVLGPLPGAWKIEQGSGWNVEEDPTGYMKIEM